ncbi:hypothetical protein [Crossiella sp. CA198]|uniref:hypothetical protein n=1 Tax=Crossiella sp. CA198 TaxID=3455607 RepID=UPI003F8D2AE2
MTTPEFDEAAFRAAIDELDSTIGQAQEELYRFERENQPTREELAALQQAALRGELGDDMRSIARRVDDGQDTWQSVFNGTSPAAGLLRGHIDRMVAANREAIGEAIEEDPDFDPRPDL